MNRIFCLARAFVLVGLVLAPAVARASGGYIFDAEGMVTIAADKKSAPRLATKLDSVAPGAVIRTADNSRAVLKFEDGQVVSLQANSTFQVREYRYQPRQPQESSIVFSMFKGGMRFITGQIGQANREAFRLATPHATIGIRGTDFLVVMANDSTYGQVLSGSISMTNAAGMAVVNAGETALVRSATALGALVPGSSVPAGVFGELAAAPVPAATPGPIPAAPVSATVPAAPVEVFSDAAAIIVPSPGGAAAGGAAMSTEAAAGGAATGISATTIGIGIGVAAVVAATASRSSNATTVHH